jgi:molybdenum cofactor cytidylyltransferase
MGRPKQLLPFAGTTLLRHAAKRALATELGPVVVVLGAEAMACGAEIADLPVTVVHNADWAEGMGTSLRSGVEALESCAPASEGALVLLHDQPLIPGESLRQLAELWQPPRWTIATAFYGGRPGVPAVFDRSHFAELKALPPGEGAKRVLLQHAAASVRLDVPEALDDLDSPADYERLGAVWVDRS